MRRRVLITGVTKGLGRAACDYFARHGHEVVGCGRDRGALEELRGIHPDHSFAQVDVSEEAEVSAWAEERSRAGFRPDLLLNNAALCHEPQPVWAMSGEEFDRITRVNLVGVAHVLRHWVPRMLERREGVIVNFSSGWGRSVAAGMGAYCMTKWGIEGLTLALAEDLPTGMAAVALNPGIINTFMLEQCFGASARGYEIPRQWAERAGPFLLGLNATHNGQSLSVD